jgi:WD40 repeat protein
VSPDSRLVVSGGCDNVLNVWDAQSGTKVRTLQDDARVVFCAVTPDGRSIVSASIAGWHTGQSKKGDWRPVQEYGALKVWDAGDRRARSRTLHAGMSHLVLACAMSADGRFVVMGGQSGDVSVWDVGNGEQVLRLDAPRNDVGGCAVSPDGRFIVSGDYAGTLKTWSAESGEELSTLSAGGGPVRACAVSPDGQFVVSGSGSTLKMWDVGASEELAMIPLLGTVTGVALHPWRPLAAAGDSAGAFYLVDLLGIAYGPIVGTPVDQRGGPIVRCPACSQDLAVEEAWLGEVVPCPSPGCGLELRVSPVIVTSRANRWWRRGRSFS